MGEPIRYAYGLRLQGLNGVAELMPAGGAGEVEPITDDPLVRIRQRSAPPPEAVALDGRRGVRMLADGRTLALDREHGTATFYGAPLAADVLAHPYLGPVATTFNRWAGRESFHAGGFVRADRVWAVLGPRTAGKSTLLATLAARGVPVLADDILVVDGTNAHAGPRCVDLREPVPGHPVETRRVRGHTRLRVPLPPIADRLPLGGWLFLHWGGDDPSLTPVPATELLSRLAGQRSWHHLPSDPAVLLALATLPAWDLYRPRDWAALAHTCELLETGLTDDALPGVRP